LVIAALFGEAVILTVGIFAFAIMTCQCTGGQTNGIRDHSLQDTQLYLPGSKQERPIISLLWSLSETPSLLVSAFEWLKLSVSITI